MPDLNLPAKIRAGDTLKFTDTVPDYPATDGWTLHYVLINTEQKITFNASGAAYDFNEAISASANWKEGDYTWQAYVDGVSGERHTVGTGEVTVLPDFTKGPRDQRHHVEKVLAAIEATLEGKASSDQENVQIGNRAIKRFSPEQLLMWRDRYKAELRSIKQAEGLSKHKSTTRVRMKA